VLFGLSFRGVSLRALVPVKGFGIVSIAVRSATKLPETVLVFDETLDRKVKTPGSNGVPLSRKGGWQIYRRIV
jgi:hypothetical protein